MTHIALVSLCLVSVKIEPLEVHKPFDAGDPLMGPGLWQASQSCVGKSSTFLIYPQIAINFSYFSSNFAHLLPHFGPPGGQLAHPERPWLCHCKGHGGIRAKRLVEIQGAKPPEAVGFMAVFR